MTWMLDTNACIRYLNGRSPGLRTKLETVDPSRLLICSVVKAELFFGAARSNDPAKTLSKQKLFLSRFRSLPFDDAAAESYALIRADLSTKGTTIGPNDLLIAAICHCNNITLVTHNLAEFNRVSGLKIEDWED